MNFFHAKELIEDKKNLGLDTILEGHSKKSSSLSVIPLR